MLIAVEEVKHDEDAREIQRAQRARDIAANVASMPLERRQRKREPPPYDTCVICLRLMLPKDALVAMKCTDLPQHVFHEDCLMQWRSENGSAARLCPICLTDPALVAACRRHLASVQRTVARERRAWCLPRKLGKHARVAVVWIASACMALLLVSLLGTWIWHRWAMPLHTGPLRIVHAAEAKDTDLFGQPAGLGK